MISQVSGTVVHIGTTFVVVDVGGLGLRVLCTPATAAAQRSGAPTTLQSSLVVREDSLTLYGFLDADERDCFELVQSVSGVGPRIALAVVSVLNPADLRTAIATADVKALTRVPGIGQKVAQRMALELKDKVGAPQSSRMPLTGPAMLWREQVAAGLVNLGWSSKDADAACERITPMAEADPSVDLAVLMRAALQMLAK